MKTLNVGFIGAGEIAAYALPVFAADSSLKLAAIADPNRAAAEKLAAQANGSAVYADYRELLSRADVDVVYIATPPFLHKQMMLDCIAAGKHLVCEKPFVMNVAEVREIEEAAKSKPNLKINCCSCRFITATAYETKKLITSGELGTITHVRFISTQPGRPRRMTRNDWKADATKAGGGLVMDWCCYEIDFLLYVLGEQFTPTKVLGWTNVPPEQMETQYKADLQSSDGRWIHIERISGEPGLAQASVQFRGTEGGLDLSMIPSEQLPVLHKPREFAQPTETRTIEAAKHSWLSIHLTPLQDLIAAIREDRQTLTPISKSIEIQRVLDGIYKSAQSQQVVTL